MNYVKKINKSAFFMDKRRRKKQERKTMLYILHTSCRQNIMGEKQGQSDLGEN